MLAEAIAHVAHPAIRNRGTIGGSLAHADPASELPACMVALGATIVVRGPGGERRIAAEEFFTGIYETALSPQELLVAVELPVARKNSAHFFHEFARRHGDYAIVGLAAQAIVRGEQFADLRLGFFAVGDRPLLAKAAGRLDRRRHHAGGVGRGVGALLGEELDPHGGPAGNACHAPASGESIAGALRVHAAFPSRSLRRERQRDDCRGDFARGQWRARRSRMCCRGSTWRIFCASICKLTGTHVGCEHGVCGACTVRVNGEIVRSCLMLAVQTQDASVETIEGLSDSGEIADLQAAFRDRNALQCGFCTPGMLMAAQDLLKHILARRTASKFASICPAITAAAPAIRPSSTPSRPQRGRAAERRP